MEITRRQLAIALVIVFVVNLVAMGAGAAFAYRQSPERPERVVGPTDEVLITDERIREGKAVFQQRGLMNLGSVLGNGAYFGSDYTADALDRLVAAMRRHVARTRFDTPYGDLRGPEQASVDAVVERQPATGPIDEEIRLTAAEAAGVREVRAAYVDRYHEGARRHGIPAGFVASAADARRVADFAVWTALFSATDRPGSDVSYTNEWPYAPGAGNTPPASALLWSVVAMVVLVGGGGLGIWLYQAVDLPEPAARPIDVPDPSDVDLVPSQVAAARFVPIAAVMFLLQTLLGGLLAHYYIERGGFYGLADAVEINALATLPFGIVKAWHIDLAVLWIATLWLSIGLFLAPLLTGSEPANQGRYVSLLLGGLIVVVAGGLAGIWLGAQGFIDGQLWWILGNEGLEYLEVGRLWQVGLLAGFVLWTVLIARGFRPLLRR